ncbi:MAG: IS110 family transposase [Candidatus Methylomirabilales bacterium]
MRQPYSDASPQLRIRYDVPGIGLDYHKRYSQVNALDEQGQKRVSARLPNDFSALQAFFHSLGEPCQAVLEAGWNWGLMYDWLEQLHNVTAVQLAHPYRTRAIATAQVKTDAIDAHTLAQLLRAGLIPRAHIPSPDTRRLRELLRQRLFLVRLRTMLKNRIHTRLDRYHVPRPTVSDLFGKRGRQYLSRVLLPPGAQELLAQDLRLLERLSAEIAQTEQWLQGALGRDRRVEVLRTVPGLGRLLAAVIALEIDVIRRFARPAKLVAYAGLAPSTHASGGRIAHGRLLKQSNKWLRWALVEAAWVAVRHDPYFRSHFGRRCRAKGPQTAIVAVARRLAEVIWHVLAEDRPYEVRPSASAGQKAKPIPPAALVQA